MLDGIRFQVYDDLQQKWGWHVGCMTSNNWNNLQPNLDANNDSRDVVFKNDVMGLATRGICLQPVEWTNPEDQNTTRASRRVASRCCGSPHCRSVEKKTAKSRQHAIFSIQIITKFAQKWRNWGNKSPFFDFLKAPPSQAVANDSGFQWLPGWGRLAWHFDSEVGEPLPRWINYGTCGCLWLTPFNHGLYGYNGITMVYGPMTAPWCIEVVHGVKLNQIELAGTTLLCYHQTLGSYHQQRWWF